MKHALHGINVNDNSIKGKIPFQRKIIFTHFLFKNMNMKSKKQKKKTKKNK